MPEPTEVLRNTPMQQRSATRVTLLLDAAADLIDEKGIDGLTTSDVAARSQSSVGVVYRYYPNIQSLLLALAARNLERFLARTAEHATVQPANWLDGLDPVVDLAVEMARTEPGFRALRFGSLIDQRFVEGRNPTNLQLAHAFTKSVSERYGIPITDQFELDIEVAVEVSEALLIRAFQYEKNGDERFIAKTREVLRDLLSHHAVEVNL
jgi:AcrR family transcriptional regulator